MRYRRGFTLVEILIAVTVLSVIAAMSVGSYMWEKRRAEHRAAVATARALAGAVANYFYSFHTIPATASTAASVTTYGAQINDGRFFNYRVVPGGGTFTINVDYRTGTSGGASATYTFNAQGDQTACSGSPCVS